MTPSRRALASATLAASVIIGMTRAAAAESHRVASVDPDAQLARALQVAVAPWGVAIVEVHIAVPGATMPIPVDRARAIARDVHADVVVWVSAGDRGDSLWLYDLASDRASARRLEKSPPFDATTAAAVALAVKTLLRGTVVAPPRERLEPAPTESTWRLGVDIGAALHVGTPLLPEGRLGLQGSFWPAWLHNRWGVSVGVESGSGLQIDSDTFTGTIRDSAVRLGMGWRAPLSRTMAFQPSLDAALHWVRLDGTLRPSGTDASKDFIDFAIEPRVALSASFFGGRLVLAPWVGAALFQVTQRFLVHGVPVANLGSISLESAVRAEVTFP